MFDEKLTEVEIQDKLESDYLDYSVYVIHDRALPRVEDGLKPVQRRILYSFYKQNSTPTSSYKKCASIVGDCIKLHPHGETSIFDALCKMALDWGYRYPLVDPQGSFGSRDGDGPAAMRYVEARLTKFGSLFFDGIDKKNVDMFLNYTHEIEEPDLLPVRFPNLLVNPVKGIAVGMATDIPSHNLKDVCTLTQEYIKREINIDDVLSILKGPDFPTGGLVEGKEKLKNIYLTGSGQVSIKARYEIVKQKNKTMILFRELPFRVLKSELIAKIAKKIEAKEISGISEIHDLSDRNNPLLIEITLQKDANPEVVINNLYQKTHLQTTHNANYTVLVGKEPKVLDIFSILKYWLEFRKNVLKREFTFDLNKIIEQLITLEAYLVALGNIAKVIEIIQNSESVQVALDSLKESLNISEKFAKIILDMKISKLVKLERSKIEEDSKKLQDRKIRLESLLNNKSDLDQYIIDDLEDVKKQCGDSRVSEISYTEPKEISDIDLVPKEDFQLVITKNSQYYKEEIDGLKSQNRGGLGSSINLLDGDRVELSFSASSHSKLCIFTNLGKVYNLNVFELPNVSRKTSGKDLSKYLNFKSDEFICKILPLDEKEVTDKYVLLVTKFGYVKKLSVSEIFSERALGLGVIKFNDGDSIVSVLIQDSQKEMFLLQNSGDLLRTSIVDLREMSRHARGSRCIKLVEDSFVVGAGLIDNENQKLLIITDKGYGKVTPISPFKQYSRNATGSCAILLKEGIQKYGKVIYGNSIDLEVIKYITLVTDENKTIKIDIGDLKIKNRYTVGERLIRFENDSGKVVSVSVF